MKKLRKAKNSYKETNFDGKYFLYCFALYRNLSSSQKVLNIYKAEINTDTPESSEFILISANLTVAKNLLYVGIIDQDFQFQQYSPYLIRRFLFLVYPKKITICKLTDYSAPINEYLFSNCGEFDRVELNFDPKYEMIVNFTGFVSLFTPFVQYWVQNLTPALWITIKPKQGLGSLRTNYRERTLKFNFYMNLNFPKIRENDFWINTYGRNYMLSVEPGGYLRYRYSMDSDYFNIYFGFLRSVSKKLPTRINENSSTTYQDRQNLRQCKSQYAMIDVLVQKMGFTNENRTYNFLQILSQNSSVLFNFTKKKQSKVKIDIWGKQLSTDGSRGLTTIIFNKPITCQGEKIVNFSSSHRDKYEITLQPIKPVYNTLFESLPFRAKNHTKIQINKEERTKKILEQQKNLAVKVMESTNQNSSGYQLAILDGQVSGLSMPFDTFYVEMKISDILKVGNVTDQNPVFLTMNQRENGVIETVFATDVAPAQTEDYSVFLIRDMDLRSKGDRRTNVTEDLKWDIRWFDTSFYGNNTIFGQFYPGKNQSSQFYLLDSENCYLNVKVKQSPDLRKKYKIEEGSSWSAGRMRVEKREVNHEKTLEEIGVDFVNLTIRDQNNQTHTIQLKIETNDIQSRQNISVKNRVVIQIKSNFSSFRFYDHLETTGSWFDLNHSLDPQSNLTAVADNVIHSFTELNFVNYVQRPKYLNPTNRNTTVFKGSFLYNPESYQYNDIVLYEGFLSRRCISNLKVQPQMGNSSFQLINLGQYREVIAATGSAGTSYEFLYSNFNQRDVLYAELGIKKELLGIKEIKLVRGLPFDSSKANSSYLLISLLGLDTSGGLWFYTIKGKPVEYNDYMVPEYSTAVFSTAVTSFDYISSYQLNNHYGYVIFAVDGSHLHCYGFSSKDATFGQIWTIDTYLEQLGEEIMKLDYLSYIKVRHNDTDDSFDMVLDGDDQQIYVFRASFLFAVNFTDKDLFNMTVQFNTTKGIEKYVKPINMDSVDCDTTKDFFTCASPVNYPEAFQPDQRKYQTMLFVWARVNGEYAGNGYTYRMETLGEIEPRGAFAIWDYWENTIIVVNQFDKPKLVKLEKNIELRLKNWKIGSAEKINWDIENLTLRLRANRFTDPSYSIKMKGEAYADIVVHVDYFLIFFIVIVVLVLGLCIGLCCYLRRLYRRLMGMDKKPRIRIRSYVSSIESTKKNSMDDIDSKLYE